MKKISALVLVLFVLVGCSDAYVQSPSSDMLFKVGGKEVTEKQLFEVMKRTDKGNLIMAQAEKDVTLDVEDASITEKGKEQLEQVKAALGERFEEVLTQLNVDEQGYLDKFVYPTLKLNFMIESQIKTDFDSLVAEYQPKKARILEVSDAEQAASAREKISNGDKFDDVAVEFGSGQSQFTGKETIYNMKGTQFPTPVAQFITTQATPGLSEVLTDDASGKSYIVQIIEVDATRFQDELIAQWTTDQNLSKKYKDKIFVDNEFKVYDKDIYTNIETNYKGLLTN